MKNRTAALVISTALAAGTALGYAVARPTPPQEDGAYFCCDAEPCVISTDGDCKDAVQWCEKTAVSEDGNVTCAQW